jgi:hypothetical protein
MIIYTNSYNYLKNNLGDLPYRKWIACLEQTSKFDNETIVELEESLLLCYTGVTHDSGNIHSDQKE